MTPTPVSFKNIPTIHEIKNGYPSVRALFFDMDGTIFNTEFIHAEALLKMALKYQIKIPFNPQTMYELMVGKADHLLFDIIQSWEGVPQHWNVESFVLEKNSLVIEILQKTSLETYFATGVQKLLKEAKSNGFYLGLVTSSEKIITKKLLKLTELENFFHLILTRDDCPKHKPDPWPYLKAMEISGHETHEIIIFEDSRVGIEAAIASGNHVIKVEWY
jgi:HAD superfamily hydrolase (TIGR01509 family)